MALLVVYRGTEVARWGSNLGLIAAALAAGAHCMLAAARSRGVARRAWLLFGAACLSWGTGQTIWTTYETVLGRSVPFPSLADLGYLGLVPLAVAALLSLSGRDRHGARLVRMVLDGLVTASSLLVVSWALILGPLVHDQGAGWLAQAIGLAYPIGDVVMITIVASFVSQARRGGILPVSTLLTISGALLSLAVADSGFTYLTTKGHYASGDLIDSGWFLGFVLLFLAARRPYRSPDDEESFDLPRRAAVATPYLAVLSAVVVAAVLQATGGSLEDFVVWGLVATTLLLVARQYLSILENHHLALTLEERVRARTAEVRRGEERFGSLVQNSSDVVTILDSSGLIRYQSASVERIFGYEPDLLVGTEFCDLIAPEERQDFLDGLHAATQRAGGSSLIEVGIRHRDGTWCRSETAVTNLLSEPSVEGLVLNTRDITERKRLEDLLVHQAFHDPLTGLANGALLRDRLAHALAQRPQRRRALALLFCDLDGFKRVNDSLGHSSGDRLLVAVGERLRAVVRPGDTVARMGGDEFAILLEEVMFEAEVNLVASRLAEAVRAPILVDGHELFVTMSIGIAMAERETQSADSLLRDADLAMYRAKSQGLGSYERFEVTMRTAAVDRIGLETDLHHALERNELSLHYQPIFDLTTNSMVGVEALLRWDHPTRGAIPPSEFVPLAEWSSLIVDIGRWVLDEACRQMREWEHEGAGIGRLTLSVNLSARQLLHPGLMNDVASALERSGLDPSQLVLEMTETVLLDHDEETVSTLELLKALGVRLAIDDFGTGYSSLSYLHRFPFDILKIDRSFIEHLSSETFERSLAGSILRIGRALSLEMVAEGIEEPEQLQALRAMGCDLGQGYYLARPMTASRVAELVTAAPRTVSSVTT